MFLNIILPGLGFAYLGKWGYAIFAFIWTPLRLWVGIAIILKLPFSTVLGEWGYIVNYALLYSWWLFVMYDVCKFPYQLAVENNHTKTTEKSDRKSAKLDT